VVAQLGRRALIGGLALPALARAQGEWPTRPLRIIAPYTPGGGIDTTARLLALVMGRELGQPMVVENRPGSAGMIGAAEASRGQPDGYTLLVDAIPHVANPQVLTGIPFDYLAAFAPVSLSVIVPHVMVVPLSSPARTVAEFIALAKSRPGQLAYGTPGALTASHFASALLANRAGIELVHVPYRGGTAALPDLMSGNIAMMMGTVSSSVPLVTEGRIRCIGVTTRTRLANLPDVPTIAEQGLPGYEMNEWNGLFTVAGTPPAVLARLSAAAQATMRDPVVQARMATLGLIPVGSTAEDFASFIAGQREIVRKLIADNRMSAG
jgi:tripartite-type tricarboxylate transporter receptor subunit TctC